MERVDFIKRIQDRDLIKNDSNADWQAMSTAYPYASLVQLMHYQKAGSPSRKKINLFFEHPLQLNKLLQGFDFQKNTDKVIVDSKVQEEIVEVAKEEEYENVVELKKESEVVEEPNTVKTTVVAEKLQEQHIEVKSPNKKDDVLELINELADENPIKKPVLDMPIAEEAKNEDEPSAEPQNLMVMMSFTDWLNFYKSKNESDAEDKKGRDAIRSAWQKEKLAEAMDDEEDVVPEDIFEKAMKSVSFGDNLVTEPLAELYAKQGKIEKAIELYKKLSLLNPEKRAYFAAKIKNLHL